MRKLILLVFFAVQPWVATAQLRTAASNPATQTVVAYPTHMQGRRTASGERYNPNGLTVAHPSLPFGTMLELSVSGSDRSVMVTVNDRGSLLGSGQLIASTAAMRRLGLDEEESATVSVREWKSGRDAPRRAADLAEAEGSDDSRAAPAKPPVTTAPSPPQVASPPADARPGQPRFSVQLASFSDRKAAEAFALSLEGAWIQTASMGARSVHRVFYGRFAERVEADGWQARLEGLGMNGYVRTLQ